MSRSTNELLGHVLERERLVSGIRSDISQVAGPRNQNPEQEINLEGNDKSKWPNGHLEQVFGREEPASALSSGIPQATSHRNQDLQQESENEGNKPSLVSLVAAVKRAKIRNMKKKPSEIAKGDLRRILEQVGDVDCVALLEAKLDLKKLLALPGFSQWCTDKGYNHVYISWSEKEEKGGAGYAGIVVLSKVKATRVQHGIEGLQDKEARVMTIDFETYTLVAVYTPCTGYDKDKMSARKNFDRLLAKHTRKLTERKRMVVMTGDLNVNPRTQDSHPLAFLQCRKLKQQSGMQDDPGCSYQEVSMYHEIVAGMKGVNV